MKRRSFFLAFLLLALLAGPAWAQSEADSSADCEVGELDMSTADASLQSDAPAPTSSEATSAVEQRVQDIIEEGGIHVVHFWAPWCANSRNELGYGWDELVAENASVTFTFVTVWNEGKDGAATLDDYNLPDRVTELTLPGGSETNRSERVHAFLGLPMTWIPTTWIFHNNGELAFALNYGEMKMATLQRLIDVTAQNW